MKLILLALGLVCWALPAAAQQAGSLDPCVYQKKSSVSISTTAAAGTVSLVAISGTTSIYVCGISFTVAASATSAASVKFESGTGGTCATPTATFTGTYGSNDAAVSATPTAINYGDGTGTIFSTASANAVCIVTAGTTISVQGVMSYVQQ